MATKIELEEYPFRGLMVSAQIAHLAVGQMCLHSEYSEDQAFREATRLLAVGGAHLAVLLTAKIGEPGKTPVV